MEISNAAVSPPRGARGRPERDHQRNRGVVYPVADCVWCGVYPDRVGGWELYTVCGVVVGECQLLYGAGDGSEEAVGGWMHSVV